MSEIKTTLDPRISADVDERGRVNTQMQALLDKPADQFTGEDLATLQKLQTEFDGLTGRIEAKQKAASAGHAHDITQGLITEAEGMNRHGETPRQAPNAPKTADEQIAQANSNDNYRVDTVLRGEVVHQLLDLYNADPDLREIKQAVLGIHPVQQDVIGRIPGTGVDPINATATSIVPQGVEAGFVEVLRSARLGPHAAGIQMWYTPTLEPVKFPKAVPAAGVEPGSATAVPAERQPDVDFRDDDNPTFDFVNTQVREYSALFAVDKSAEYATPAMIGAKVGELLARNLMVQLGKQASIGTDDQTAEGLLPNVVLSGGIPTSGNFSWLNGATVTDAPGGGVPTYATIMAVMGAKGVFDGGGEDVWMANKPYVYNSLIGMRGTDGHPIFKVMGDTNRTPYDTLMGSRIVYSDYMTDANTNNRLAAVFGNFYTGAVCRRAGDITIATSTEGQAFRRNQIHYRGLAWEAVVVINANQFSFLKGKS